METLCNYISKNSDKISITYFIEGYKSWSNDINVYKSYKDCPHYEVHKNFYDYVGMFDKTIILTICSINSNENIFNDLCKLVNRLQNNAHQYERISIIRLKNLSCYCKSPQWVIEIEFRLDSEDAITFCQFVK